MCITGLAEGSIISTTGMCRHLRRTLQKKKGAGALRSKNGATELPALRADLGYAVCLIVLQELWLQKVHKNIEIIFLATKRHHLFGICCESVLQSM